MMKTIDIDRCIRAATDAVKSDGALQWRLRNSYDSFDFDAIRGTFLGGAWAECVSSLEPVEGKPDPLAVEKVVLGLIRRGVPRDRFDFSDTVFYARLDHFGFYMAKKQAGFEVRLFGTRGGRDPLLQVDPGQFADMCMQFDASMPEIEKAGDELVGYFKEKAWELSRRAMELKIQRNILDAMIEQYVKPLGIKVRYHIDPEDGTVSASFRQELTGELVLPMEKFQEALKDIQPVLELMKAVVYDEYAKF